MRLTSFVLLLLLISSISSADIITLTNGKTVEGTIVREDENNIIVELGFGEMAFSRGEVSSVKKKDYTPIEPLTKSEVRKLNKEALKRQQQHRKAVEKQSQKKEEKKSSTSGGMQPGSQFGGYAAPYQSTPAAQPYQIRQIEKARELQKKMQDRY